jgi:hypothetical protein
LLSFSVKMTVSPPGYQAPADKRDRKERTRHALATLGGSVLSAGMTTLVAAFALYWGQVQFFNAVRARPGRLRGLSVSHSKSVSMAPLCGRIWGPAVQNGGVRPRRAGNTGKMLVHVGPQPARL